MQPISHSFVGEEEGGATHLASGDGDDLHADEAERGQSHALPDGEESPKVAIKFLLTAKVRREAVLSLPV